MRAKFLFDIPAGKSNGQTVEKWVATDIPNLKASTSGRLNYKNKIVKVSKGGKGYLYCHIDGKTIAVHRVVARAFHGPCPPDKEVNHKDLDKTNCKPCNLEYTTHRANMAHARKAGHYSPPPIHIGTSHPNSKMTKRHIRIIRSLSKRGVPQRSIAKTVGLSQATVWSIVNGRTWKEVT